MLGFNSISEQPISSLEQNFIFIAVTVNQDLPFDTPTYYQVNSKILCWIIDTCIEDEWLIACNNNLWSVTDICEN